MQLRRHIASALAFAGLTLGAFPFAHGAPLDVNTQQGIAHGKTIDDGKVKVFLGLPYAAPPVGDLRWKAPMPPTAWKGRGSFLHFRRSRDVD